jgi:hypothetical protein
VDEEASGGEGHGGWGWGWGLMCIKILWAGCSETANAGSACNTKKINICFAHWWKNLPWKYQSQTILSLTTDTRRKNYHLNKFSRLNSD